MTLFFSYPCRHDFLSLFLTRRFRSLGALLAFCICAQGIGDNVYGFQTDAKVVKSPQQWRQELNELEYHVTREKGTEFAYSGKYWDHKEQGVYTCRCCGKPLFDSKTKFESGTGWPSYYQPINPSAVSNVRDTTAGMVRTEVVCSRCDAHLGHVFDDGPNPTGLRYCMNSVALDFKKANKAKLPGDPEAKSNRVHGFGTPQKLLEAVRIAVAENSKDKFLSAVCWQRLPENRKSALESSTRSLTSKPVTSLRLAEKTGQAPAGFVYNVEHVGNVMANFEDGTSGSIWAYGRHDGKYFIAVPIKEQNAAELDGGSETKTTDEDYRAQSRRAKK